MKTIKYFLIIACFFITMGSIKANCGAAFSTGYAVAVENHVTMLSNCWSPSGVALNWLTGSAIGAFNDMISGLNCISDANTAFNNTVDNLIYGYDCCTSGC